MEIRVRTRQGGKRYQAEQYIKEHPEVKLVSSKDFENMPRRGADISLPWWYLDALSKY